MNDTSPEIAAMVQERLMQRTGAERFRMGVDMFEAARRMVLASLPPGLSEAELKGRLFERIYGFPLPATMSAAVGQPPLLSPMDP
jgi:hypothetical protein